MNWKSLLNLRHKAWDYVGLGAFILAISLFLVYLLGGFAIGDIEEPQPKMANVEGTAWDPNAQPVPVAAKPTQIDLAARLGFIAVLDMAGKPVIYEAVKGSIDHSSVFTVSYTNSEGVERRFNGTYLYSKQPIKLTARPLIETQTAAQFMRN